MLTSLNSSGEVENMESLQRQRWWQWWHTYCDKKSSGKLRWAKIHISNWHNLKDIFVIFLNIHYILDIMKNKDFIHFVYKVNNCFCDGS